jgi:hypothetical protein
MARPLLCVALPGLREARDMAMTLICPSTAEAKITGMPLAAEWQDRGHSYRAEVHTTETFVRIFRDGARISHETASMRVLMKCGQLVKAYNRMLSLGG